MYDTYFESKDVNTHGKSYCSFPEVHRQIEEKNK